MTEDRIRFLLGLTGMPSSDEQGIAPDAGVLPAPQDDINLWAEAMGLTDINRNPSYRREPVPTPLPALVARYGTADLGTVKPAQVRRYPSHYPTDES